MSERTEVSREGTDKILPWWDIRHLLTHAPRLLAVLLAGTLAAVVMINWNRWTGSAGSRHPACQPLRGHPQSGCEDEPQDDEGRLQH